MTHAAIPGHWDFMLAVYGDAGVAEACLDLQRDIGVDVPLLLIVLHGAGQGVLIDAATIGRLDAECRAWRSQVVHPLRAVRTIMKTDPWIDEVEAVAPLREAVKALELRAEKIESDVLAHTLAGVAQPGVIPSAATVLAAVHEVIAHFAGAPVAQMPASAAVVADAVWHRARDWPRLAR